MSSTKKDFESNLNELENIVKKLEDGSCTLDESIELFEQGMKLSRDCSKQLANAKQKITLLTRAQEESADA